MMSEAEARAAVESGRVKHAYGQDVESFGEFILSEQVRKPVTEVAEAIAAVARSTSARDESKPDGESMADKWAVSKHAGTRTINRSPRVRVDVYNPDIAAAAQEFGSGPRRRQRTRVLGRAAGLFGDFHDHGEGEA